MTPNNLLICLPTYRDEVHVNFAFSLTNTARALTDAGSSFQTMHIGSSHIIRARNLFANYFLQHAEFTHLLFLDTDMHFPAQAVINEAQHPKLRVHMAHIRPQGNRIKSPGHYSGKQLTSSRGARRMLRITKTRTGGDGCLPLLSWNFDALLFPAPQKPGPAAAWPAPLHRYARQRRGAYSRNYRRVVAAPI